MYSLIAIGARTVVRIGEEYDDGVRYVVGKEMAGRPPFPSASVGFVVLKLPQYFLQRARKLAQIVVLKLPQYFLHTPENLLMHR